MFKIYVRNTQKMVWGPINSSCGRSVVDERALQGAAAPAYFLSNRYDNTFFLATYKAIDHCMIWSRLVPFETM